MAKIWLGDEETYGLECCFDGKPGSYGETEVSDAELAELATLSAAVDRFYELLREYRDRAKAQKTYARALEVLGSEEAAQAWWTAPHPLFGGKTPEWYSPYDTRGEIEGALDRLAGCWGIQAGEASDARLDGLAAVDASSC